MSGGFPAWVKPLPQEMEGRLGGILGLYRTAETAASREGSRHNSPSRFAGFHHVLQNSIHRVFVKNSQIAIGMNIEFERFEFEAGFVWHVVKRDGAEIRQARFGADGRVFRDLNGDFITWKLVGPCFDIRQWHIQPAFRMLC